VAGIRSAALEKCAAKSKPHKQQESPTLQAAEKGTMTLSEVRAVTRCSECEGKGCTGRIGACKVCGGIGFTTEHATPPAEVLQAAAQPVEEQAAFEKWLSETRPSGDCEAVMRSWEESWARADWLEQAATPPKGERTTPVEPTIIYSPVETRPHLNGRHPNDNEPVDRDRGPYLDLRGDDKGQGLDCFWKWGYAAGWNDHKRHVATPTAAAPEVPAGWKLVPEQPTEEMHAAAVRTIVRCAGNADFPPRVYRAMLAAAPSHPAEQPKGTEQ
jgi:hypothetical protein